MADLFREVDEEVRKEQTMRLLRRYRVPLTALVVLCISAVIGFHGWRYYQQEAKISASNEFSAALELVEENNEAAALQALAELGEPSDGGYAVLAAFQRVQLLRETGDEAGAIALLEEIAGQEVGAFSSVAQLLSVLLQIDSGDPAALNARLDGLIKPGNSFRAGALELKAAIALRQGDREAATDLYRQLADDLEAPQGMRARATEMLAALRD